MGRSITFSKMHNGIEVKTGVNVRQSYKNHLHEELSIGLVLEGETTIEFEGQRIKLHKGDGILIPAYRSHMCVPKNIEHWNFYMLYINQKLYDSYFDFTRIRKLNDEELIAYQRLVECSNQENNKLVAEEALIELLLLLSGTPDVDESLKENKDVKIISIYNDIKTNFMKDLSLDLLAEKFNINKYTFIRKFRKYYDTTPSSFQLQLKMARAKKLLMDGVSIQDVIAKLNFYDQAHFIREYKKMNGITPSKYQKNILNSK